MKDTSLLQFATPDTILVVLGVATLLIAGVSYGLDVLIRKFAAQIGNNYMFNMLTDFFRSAFVILLIGGIAVMIIAGVVHAVLPDARKIRHMIEMGLFDSSYGNPLHLKEGELLPRVTCKKIDGQYEIVITATSVTVEDLANVSPSISSALNKKHLARYAVVGTDTDLALNQVAFRIEDVMVDKSLIVKDVED